MKRRRHARRRHRLLRLRKFLRPHVRYLKILLREFRVTIALIVLFWGTGTLLFFTTHPDNLTFAQALYGAMALFGLETAVAMPKTAGFTVSAMYILYPALGLTLFADAIVRLSSLVLSRHNDEVRWVKVVASTYKNHVILCGLGQVGFRTAQQLKEFDEEVIVVEKDANAPRRLSSRPTSASSLLAEVPPRRPVPKRRSTERNRSAWVNIFSRTARRTPSAR
jgi:voltage-gated potassium channel Kch